MDKIKLIEKLIIITFDIVSFLTFCFIANLINSLFVGVVTFSIFAIINALIPDKYRIHADRLLHCFILSLLFLFSCIIVYKIALNYMSNEESIILSILLVILANFTTTSFLWWKRNELNERVVEWVRFNLNNEKIIEYKEQLKKFDNRKYIIFVYYFEEHKSFETISKLMDIDRQRIGEEIAIMSHYIEYGIRLRWS
jgi:hypothetical protein